MRKQQLTEDTWKLLAGGGSTGLRRSSRGSGDFQRVFCREKEEHCFQVILLANAWTPAELRALHIRRYGDRSGEQGLQGVGSLCF